MNKYIEAVRDLANEKQTSFDISEILYNHGCIYLLSKIKGKNKYTDRLKAENVLTKDIKPVLQSSANLKKTISPMP